MTTSFAAFTHSFVEKTTKFLASSSAHSERRWAITYRSRRSVRDLFCRRISETRSRCTQCFYRVLTSFRAYTLFHAKSTLLRATSIETCRCEIRCNAIVWFVQIAIFVERNDQIELTSRREWEVFARSSFDACTSKSSDSTSSLIRLFLRYLFK